MINQITYWGIALFALLQFLACLSLMSFWAWIVRIPIAVFLWSSGWFVIAKLHNMISSESWLTSNYAWTQGVEILSSLTKFVSVLWHASEATYFEKIAMAFQQAYQILTWYQPDSIDLVHLNFVLFIAIYLSLETSSNQGETQSVADEQIHEPKQYHANQHPTASELQFQTEPSGPVNYRNFVDPYSVRSLAVSLVSDFPEHGNGQLLRAANLFEYVKKNITYVPDPIRMESLQMVQGDLIASPVETLRIRGGDCDDQAILMASLLSAVGIANRMHLVKSQDGKWHLLTEFAVDIEIYDDIVTTLDQFYESTERQTGPRVYWFFKEEPLVWLLADTTRNYVPDYAELIQSGFMVKNPDNSIQWHHLDSTY